MLRPLRYASCVRIATLSPTTMVFEWPSKMVVLPHPVAVLLHSDQGFQTHGNEKWCLRFSSFHIQTLRRSRGCFFHNIVAHFLHMLYTSSGMINVSRVQGIFSIAHSHIFLWQAIIWTGEKPCPNMDRIQSLIR